MQIKSSGKAPPSFDRWTDADEEKLLEAQSDIVEMAHTAIGHLKEMKKKELALAAMTMSGGVRPIGRTEDGVGC
jgi:hypothetical protein